MEADAGDLHAPRHRAHHGNGDHTRLTTAINIVPDEEALRAGLPAQADREGVGAQGLQQLRLRQRILQHLLDLDFLLLEMRWDGCARRTCAVLDLFSLLQEAPGLHLWLPRRANANDRVECSVLQNRHLAVHGHPHGLVAGAVAADLDRISPVLGLARSTAVTVDLGSLSSLKRRAAGLVERAGPTAGAAPCGKHDELEGSGVHDPRDRLPSDIDVGVVLDVTLVPHGLPVGLPLPAVGSASDLPDACGPPQRR
mmetsp:Transcript_111482/g.296274  ORF Transcript_111482/g.296274 Transcript_111482/m.296274 type:complete len:254 (+) Transcript_111482:682-1443(+)